MKSLNQLIEEYTFHLQQGDIQIAYKGLLEFFGKLRTDITKNLSQYEAGSVYQGYMDMTYFSLCTKSLKDKGLKIAIVYVHEKGTFEVWLSARNRAIAKKYEFMINSSFSDNITIVHDDTNPDAIIECILTSTPDFEEQELLIDIIEKGVKKFITAVSKYI
jgi:hypothetical protein